MSNWYIGSTKYTTVTAWAALTSYSIGNLRRQLAAPAVGSERVFRCTTAGVSLASEPSWNLTAGATTTEVSGPVWTEVTGQATYGWTAPHARLANACASGWMVAGDTANISNNHAETQAAAMSIVSPGTAASPCNFICVNDASAPPTTGATTATITTTNPNPIAISNFAYFYGITFNVGTTSSGGANFSLAVINVSHWLRFENCVINCVSSQVGNAISIGSGTASSGQVSLVEFFNTKVSFASISQGIVIARANFNWRNTPSAITGTIPTVLFTNTAKIPSVVSVIGVDLSSFNGSIIDVSQQTATRMVIENCKLHASVSISTGTNLNQSATQVDVVNSDSASNNRRERYRYQGSSKTELTIVRSGGVTDGTNQISRKIVTLSGAAFGSPFEDAPVEFWNDATGSPITITIPVVTDNVTLTNADAWIEVEYLGTAGSPQSSVGTCRVADFITTPANQPTDSTSTWTTTGLTTPVKQSLSVTVTPQTKGLIKARVMVAKASTTLYYDPQTLASAKTYAVGSEGYFNAASGGGQKSYSF